MRSAATERIRISEIDDSIERIQAISQIEIIISVQVIAQLLYSLGEYYQEKIRQNFNDHKSNSMRENIGILIRLLQIELDFHQRCNTNKLKLISFSVHARQLPISLTVIVENFKLLELEPANESLILELHEWVKGRYEKYESVARNKKIKIEQDPLNGRYPTIDKRDRINSFFSNLTALDLAEPMKKLAEILEMKLAQYKPLQKVPKLIPEENNPQVLLSTVRIRRSRL